MKKYFLICLFFPLSVFSQWKDFPSVSASSSFQWNKSGETAKNDSLRFIQGSGSTLTQSGNTLTIASSGTTTKWNEIADADADGTIALAGFETDFSSSLNGLNKAVMTVTNTTADATAATSFIELRHNDINDADAVWLRFVGNQGGTPAENFLLSQTKAGFCFTGADLEAVTMNNRGLRVNNIAQGVTGDGDPQYSFEVYDNDVNQSIIGARIVNNHNTGVSILRFVCTSGSSNFYGIGLANNVTNNPFTIGYNGIGGGDDLVSIDPVTNTFKLGDIGSANSAIYNLVIGTDGTTGTLNAQTIRGSNASQASTNKTSANLNIQAGLATGNAASGDIIFKTGITGGSGTTLQTAGEQMRIENNNGGVNIQNQLGVGTLSPITGNVTVKNRAIYITGESTPAATDSTLELDVESSTPVIRAFTGDASQSTIQWVNNDTLKFKEAAIYKFENGDLLFDSGVVLNNSSVSAGTDAFSGTAVTDTVIVSGAGSGDLYWIQITGTGSPLSTDVCRVEALSGSFVVHRLIAGTSGLTYNWKREKP